MRRCLQATIGVRRLWLYLLAELRSHMPAHVHQENAFSCFNV
jgi:hypothetical protein